MCWRSSGVMNSIGIAILPIGMIRPYLCSLLLAGAMLLASTSKSAAQNLHTAQGPATNFGIGGQIGDPSGVTLKFYQRPGLAYELLAAWDLDDFFFLNGHVLYERPIPDSPLHYYFGPGAIIGISDEGVDDAELVVGISGQVGVNFFVERFEVFLHLTPSLRIIPDTDGDVGGGIGLRYYL